MSNTKRTLTLGSLFDGSGGFPLAGILAGIEPVFASEVEPFAVRVTTKRLPEMKHYGDVSKLSGSELPPVDIITFGSPCQDLSVAGRRAGLGGERSSLFHQAIRIIREMREITNGEKPRYCVWENVPGAFSSNGGEDFRSVLEAVIGIKEPGAEVPAPPKNGWPHADIYMGDGWSVAYRLLDAQYWGVPQRRARIFLVADLGGGCAGDILFKSEGLSGYSAEGFEAWKRAARDPESSAGEAGCVCLNDQGGERMDLTGDVTGTLRAETHGQPPLVAAGFCTEHSAKSRSIGYEEETSPTLRAGVVPAAIALEHHPADCRIGIDGGDAIQTLTSRMGTGGGNVPLVMTPDGPFVPYTLKIRCGKEGGGKGALVQEDLSATLATNNDQTLFAPSAFGISSDHSNAMLSSNPHSGIYEAKTSRTLDTSGGNPGCNQGGIAVVAFSDTHAALSANDGPKGPSSQMLSNPEANFVCGTVAVEGNGARPSHLGSGFSEDGVSFTLNATEQHGVAYGIDRATCNMGQNAKFDISVKEELEPTMVARGPNAVAHPVYTTSKNSYHTEAEEDIANTLVATDYKDPPTVSGEPYYIVRRLTPTECARLQGFPDWWCRGLGTEEPTEEDIAFWTDVFEEHRRLVTHAKKPKTRAQIVRWLQDPHLDSSEYRLWGNGVALPCVWFVMAGIAWAHEMHNRGA